VFLPGVGYLVMIIGFLIKLVYLTSIIYFNDAEFLTWEYPQLFRGLQSKQIKRIEHNIAINIKETQKKIWNGVTKDVGYIRKILNEVYFLKFKVRKGNE
jgi:hypothetical protein